MSALRVGIVCDYREEGWPSMDLVAEMLAAGLEAHAPGIRARELRPAMPRIFGTGGRNLDRALGRYLAYPIWLRRRAAEYDLFHVVDHSYAHLVHALPEGRSVVTCHDLDAFRSLRDPRGEPRPAWFRALARHVLRGMQRAALVLCDSAAVADELAGGGLIPPQRLRVVPLPVHPDFGPEPHAAADAAAAGLAPDGGPLVLHVGSAAPRKRLDVVLESFARLRTAFPDARLARVGGKLPPRERALARRLGLTLLELPFLSRPVLAALYRRAAVVLLPSDREGFGLPLLEAMACGAPVVASDLPVLREVGGGAARYAPPGDAAAFATAAEEVLRGGVPASMRRSGLERAAAHSLPGHVARVTAAYREVSAR